MKRRRITAKDRHRFTQGDCGILAQALEEASGGAWEFRLTKHHMHCLVVREGVALDIEGAVPIDELVEKWDPGPLRECPMHERWAWTQPEFYRGSTRRAKELAPWLLEHAA